VLSYIESPARFFVQSSLHDNQLNAIMSAVERYCAVQNDKEFLYPEDVNENMAVCALYAEDQKWYRALVRSEPDPAGNVDVLFVDYGNYDQVSKRCSKQIRVTKYHSFLHRGYRIFFRYTIPIYV
jgi:hypothetical protein